MAVNANCTSKYLFLNILYKHDCTSHRDSLYVYTPFSLRTICVCVANVGCKSLKKKNQFQTDKRSSIIQPYFIYIECLYLEDRTTNPMYVNWRLLYVHVCTHY